MHPVRRNGDQHSPPRHRDDPRAEPPLSTLMWDRGADPLACVAPLAGTGAVESVRSAASVGRSHPADEQSYPMSQPAQNNRRIVLAARPEGAPEPDDFRLEREPVPFQYSTVDQVALPSQKAVELIDEIPRHLTHPQSGGRRGNTGDLHTSCGHIQDEEDQVPDKPH